MTKKQVILATGNAGKVREMKEMLPFWDVQGLKEIGWTADIPETGTSLKENAEIKARAVFDVHGIPVVSDDSGLLIDALNGDPGVYSARYAGEHCSPEDNINLVLQKMQGQTNRKAQFQTQICYFDGAEILFFEGVVHGVISLEKMGEKGFGYDPIFIPDGFAKSFAQMTLELKNSISHRGQALQKLESYFKS